MTVKTIPPALGSESFSCPSCGALAHQDWFNFFCRPYEKGQGPWVPAPDELQKMESDRVEPMEARKFWIEYLKKRLTQRPFLDQQPQAKWLDLELENTYVSKCYSCGALAVWIYDKLVFPQARFAVEPNDDLDEDIQLDFHEATKILDLSPRGAAALLRLCVQKVCVQLGEPGKNIDTDIASLVKKGLETTLQQALDIVRVIGNEAVHPGQIDLRDDRETAMKLFQLVNIIADAMISRPRQIAQLYNSLPATKLEAIERRDSAKPVPPPKSEKTPPQSS